MARRSRPAKNSGRRLRGTTMSSLTLRGWRSFRKALVMRRTAQRRSRWGPSEATSRCSPRGPSRSSRGPRKASPSQPRSSNSRRARASPGRRRASSGPWALSSESTAGSKNSKALGWNPAAARRPGRSSRSCQRRTGSSRVRWAAGRGARRRVAPVMKPKMPSLPMSSWARLGPALAFTPSMPRRWISPSSRRASTASTQARVMPYLQALGPPALVARVPPRAQLSQELGSGG